MLRAYVSMYGHDQMNPRPDVKILRESPVSATLDADRGLGIQVCPGAMQLAIDKAHETGIGAVGVQNCGHVGMLAYYPLMALEHDMIGVCMVSAGGRLQVPLWGSEPVFGTHPIAWGAPADKMPPFVFDVATTQVAANKLMLTRRIGSHLEPAWITDLNGDPIMEAVDSPDYGRLLHAPIRRHPRAGRPQRHRIRDDRGHHVGHPVGNGPGFKAGGGKHSQFVMAIKIDAFVDVGQFKSDLDDLLEKISSMEPSAGQERVYYAGLIEAEETEKRKREGIPYHREVVEWFNTTANELELNFSLP